MGGPSFKTEKDHKTVRDLFDKKLKDREDEAHEKGYATSDVKRGTLHREIADETGYSEVAVRMIVNGYYNKPNTITRILHKQRLCSLSKKTGDVICN